jgi:hypothetical protein
MSRGIDFIKDINDYKETWRLQVSIVDVWSVVNLSKGTKHIEIVVMDLKVKTLIFVSLIVFFLKSNLCILFILI